MNFQELKNGCMKYYNEQRRAFDLIYKWTSWLVSENWDDPRILTAGVGMLLYDWNMAYYRTRGSFDPEKLEERIRKWHEDLSEYRRRNIRDLRPEDGEQIKQIFKDFEVASRGVKSSNHASVSAAKALHLLAPHYFPPWDSRMLTKGRREEALADYYECREKKPNDYVKFMNIIRNKVDELLEDYINKHGGNKETAEAAICHEIHPEKDFKRSLVRLIDEYNWTKARQKSNFR